MKIPQGEALHLAEALEELDAQFSHPGLCGEAAAELRRLHQAAERYRHLRDGVLVDGEICEDLYVAVDHPTYPNRWALTGAELDEAVDAALAKATGAPT